MVLLVAGLLRKRKGLLSIVALATIRTILLLLIFSSFSKTQDTRPIFLADSSLSMPDNKEILELDPVRFAIKQPKTDLLTPLGMYCRNGREVILYSDLHDNVNSEADILEGITDCQLKLVYPQKDDDVAELSLTSIRGPQFVKDPQIELQVLASDGANVALYHNGELIANGQERVFAINLTKEQNFFAALEYQGIKRTADSLLSLNKSSQHSTTFIKAKKVLLLKEQGFDYVEEILKRLNYSYTEKIEEEDPAFVIVNNQKLSLKQQDFIFALAKKDVPILFLAGEYGKTYRAFNPILPVTIKEQKGKPKRLTLALMLIMDKSQSMRMQDRLNYAKVAAKEVVKNLKANDQIGIIGFDSSPFVLQKLERVEIIRNKIADKIDRLFALGATNLLPALDEAIKQLKNSVAGRKHLIILTDGRLSGSSQVFYNTVSVAKEAGITTSTVIVGATSEGIALQKMANLGGGRYYEAQSSRNLPSIFIEDVFVHKQEPKDQPLIVSHHRDSELKYQFPVLKNITQAEFKSGARNELVAYEIGETKPLFSHKNNVGVFLAGLNPRYAEMWLKWDKVVPLWRDILAIFLDSKKRIDDFEFRYLTADKAFLEIITRKKYANLTAKFRYVEEESMEATGEEIQRVARSTAPGRYLFELNIADGLINTEISGDGNEFVPFYFKHQRTKVKSSFENEPGINYALAEKILAKPGNREAKITDFSNISIRSSGNLNHLIILGLLFLDLIISANVQRFFKKFAGKG